MDNLWIWLVVEPYPSEKYETDKSSSIGMMTFPNYGKNVPKHQPARKKQGDSTRNNYDKWVNSSLKVFRKNPRLQ